MNEGQQERASLYALGLLDADEAAEFEREMAADGELRTLTAELREAVSSLAQTDTSGSPPPHLKARLLATVSVGKLRGGYFARGNVVVGPWGRWLPWAAAAALAIGCAVLKFDQSNLERHLTAETGKTKALLQARQWERAAKPDQDPLAQVSYCSLAPVPAAQQTGPQAAVLWDAARRHGRLHISGLPPAGEGKDYQLWTVETGIKDPVNSGLVKVGADNVAEVEFQPQGEDGKGPAVAFALSRERAGGVPKNEGPILFLGKLPP